MKTIHWVPTIAFALIATSCERKSSTGSAEDPQLARQVADLERKSNEAIARQQELERELENQKLAAEREAIERERQLIEEARYELEQKESETAAEEAAALLQREKDLATREGKIEVLQSTLEEKQSKLQQQESELSERDRQLAGREAITLQEPDTEEDTAPVGDYGMFHDSLSSYGSWFETPDYGYVWQPVVVRDVSWRPYTRGRWACSDQGWTWISDEPFGWATYHYGRWALCRNRGWIWVPGTQWAPSWVSWRSSGNHVGWAPLPPETLAWQENRWDSSVDATFGIGAPWFVFVETRHFGNPIHHHCLPYDRNPVFIQQTSNITHIHVRNQRIICGGPTYGDVQKQVERPLPFYRLEMDRHKRYGDSVSMRPRVEGNRLRVSAPNLANPWNHGLRPSKVRGRLDDVQVVRNQDVRPEIKERFQKVRQEEKRKADQTIRDMGGENEVRRRRLDQLAQDQQSAEKRRQDIASRHPSQTKDPAITPTADKRTVDSRPSGGKADRVAATRPEVISRPDSNSGGSHPSRSNPSPTGRKTQPDPIADPRNTGGTATKPPTRPINRGWEKTTLPRDPADTSPQDDKTAGKSEKRPMTLVREKPEFRRKNPLQEKGQEQAPAAVNPTSLPKPREKDHEAERPQPQQDRSRQLQVEEARREAQAQAQRQREQQERAQQERRKQQLEETRREQQRESLRQRAQQEETRRQQQEAQRQREREQARNQQQERARQQQMEESRREQAREQARQQQQRQEAQQQQRQEAQRQSQREQQERARQQSQQEERRGRNR